MSAHQRLHLQFTKLHWLVHRPVAGTLLLWGVKGGREG